MPRENLPKRTGLARALSKLGYCSRSQAFALISQGRVRLNGSVPKNPSTPVRVGIDRIEVQGRRVVRAEKVYLMMNKPRGIVTTASDEKGRDTVYSLLPIKLEWIAPVGRLDQASEGLLLLTNDSAWAAWITDPATHIDKVYHVQIRAIADQRMIHRLMSGIETENGERLAAQRTHVLRTGEKNSWIELTLDEGKNRQIRRMFDALGVEVLRLIRVAIGAAKLGELRKGQYRGLTAEEVAWLSRTGAADKRHSTAKGAASGRQPLLAALLRNV